MSLVFGSVSDMDVGLTFQSFSSQDEECGERKFVRRM
jgi:hypothetical protein